MRSRFRALLALTAVLLLPSSALAANHTTAEIVVVHGVPGLEVDILIDGATSDLTEVNYGDTAVINVPAGTYELGVAATGTTDAILSATATVDAGASYSVVAHLDTNGDPQLSVFVNTNTAAGIQPFHAANFGPVSIIAGGAIALDNVANGDTAHIAISGLVPGVGIGVAGSTDAAISLGDVTVPEDGVILAFAVGPDAGNDLPDVFTVAISVNDSGAPTSVPAGDAGLAASSAPYLLIAALLGGVALLATPTVARRFR
jgi:hypothetical protein